MSSSLVAAPQYKMRTATSMFVFTCVHPRLIIKQALYEKRVLSPDLSVIRVTTAILRLPSRFTTGVMFMKRDETMSSR